MATAKHPRASPRARSRWRVGTASSRNVVAFLGAGMYLRDAQRGTRASSATPTPTPSSHNHDLSRFRPALSDPPRPRRPARTTPPLGDDAGEPSTSVSSSSARGGLSPRLGGAELRRPPRARVCRFCFGEEDEEWELDSRWGASRSAWTDAWCHRVVVPGRRSGSTTDACSCNESRQQQRRGSENDEFVPSEVPHAASPPMADFLSQWFSPRATDRLSGYKRAWWQMLTNTIMAQEGTPHIVAPDQLARGACVSMVMFDGAGARFEAETVSSAVFKDSRGGAPTRTPSFSSRGWPVSAPSRSVDDARAPRRSHGSDHTRT